ncbi:phage terminase large subunit [Bacillus thuringiensis]|nr:MULTISPECIES: phage terminase large subunit [Bacillus cereus group]MEC3417081.1 phage terminase large subunit [Bacillus cereus]MED1836173.1 phage terminase large subunit [Bacillus thuringiensis]MED1574250.1 phage terminase large subunit [Bacillus paranthracis]MED2670236.1 phage terminase large subunit [Bacillus thuringiensis]MED2694231.1 phage terminase large subunit [Bacillus thuringiensis]
MEQKMIRLEPKIKGKTITELREEQRTLKNQFSIMKDMQLRGEAIPRQIEELIPQLRERLITLNRIIKSWDSPLHFMYEYFSDDLNPDNEGNMIPEGVGVEDAPDFHKRLCNTLNVLSYDEVTKRVAWSVPRGHAKSAYLSNMYPVFSIVFNIRRYILILSETIGMSRKFIEWVSDQLKYNRKLREDFGELLQPKKQLNAKDNIDGFETANGCYVQASSTGGQLRGSRYKNFRPDLIVLDDLESSKNTNTVELRQKTLDWFNKNIIPMGDVTRTGIIYMGTLVHASGLLPHVLDRADFDGKIFSAIVSEPERPDMWEEYEEIYRNQENPDRMEEAIKYYSTNKDEMDKGVRTLWNDRFPYYKLMMEKVNIGSKAFGSEFLNKPIDDESAIFKESYFQFYDDKDLFDNAGRPLPLDLYGFWDIAVGKNSNSDYNAIVTIGRDRRTGVLYVLDAWAKKCPMHVALEVAEQKIAEYRHKIFGVETIQSQYDMFRQLQNRSRQRGFYSTKLKACNPRTKKEVRIEALEPLFENGTLRIKRSQRLLQDMLLQFPQHDNDDLPDALASAVDVAGGTRRRSFYRKPAGI